MGAIDFNAIGAIGLSLALGPLIGSWTTCHVGGNLSRYTCYSCHEHQPNLIRAKHAEEGIRNIANCARCHRSGSGEGSEREGGGRDDD